MIFLDFIADLFHPKWKHSKWEVRKVAVDGLGDQKLLEIIAKTDPNANVRKAAANKLNNHELLALIAQTDPAVDVRQVVVKKLNDLESLETDEIKKNSKAQVVIELYHKIIECIPQSTSTERPYMIEDKAIEFLSKALIWRDEGYDFKIQYLPEKSYVIERALQIVKYRSETQTHSYSSDTAYQETTVYAVFEDGTEEKYSVDNSLSPSYSQKYDIESPIKSVNIIEQSELIEIVRGERI